MTKYFGTILLKGNEDKLNVLSIELKTLGFNVFNNKLPEEYNTPFITIYEDNKPSNDINLFNIQELTIDSLPLFLSTNYPFCVNPINETMIRSIFSPEYGDEKELMEFASGLILNFFKSVDVDIITLNKMLKDNDFEKMRKTFHRIKSTFGTFGLDHSKNLFAVWQKQDSFSYNDLILLNMHFSVAKHALMKWINQ